MKIVQVIPEFGVAGAEIMCETLCYELVGMGHEIVVVSFYDYHSIITERLQKKGIRIVFLGKKLGFDWTIIAKLRNVFKRENPDVIHSHRHILPYICIASLCLKIPVKVHTIHNIASKEAGTIVRKISKFFFCLGKVVPVALSSQVQKTIRAEYGLPLSKIPVILNGVSLKNCIVKQSYKIAGIFTILHVGRFSAQKNHKALVNAFAKFHRENPNTRLCLIGDGPEKEQICDIVRKNNLQDCVVFVGITDQVCQYMCESDMFILPSLYEGVPMTLIEAMGCGMPIVATAVGGIPDMLFNEKDALLIDADELSIKNAMNKLYVNENLRERCGLNALKQSGLFSSRNMANAYVSIYQRVLK